MKIAVVQHDIEWENAPATREQVTGPIAVAASAGARIIVLAEMYATGFSMRPERIAEDEGGPNETFLLEQAAQHGCWLIASIAQWSPLSRRPRNVAVVAGPDGSVHRYAKIHPFTYGGEADRYEAGTDLLTVNVEGLRVSVFICYDLRFADEFWQLALDTDCYIVPANWPNPRREAWQTLLRARAIENQAYVVGCNRVGAAKSLQHDGDSAIIDPLGTVLATAGPVQTVLVAEVDPQRVRDIRAQFPFLPDRR